MIFNCVSNDFDKNCLLLLLLLLIIIIIIIIINPLFYYIYGMYSFQDIVNDTWVINES